MTDLVKAMADYDRIIHANDEPWGYNTIKAVAFSDPVEIAYEVDESTPVGSLDIENEFDVLIQYVKFYQVILRNDPRAWDGDIPCHNGSDDGDRCGECEGCVELGKQLSDHCVLEASSEAEADAISAANPGHPVAYPLPAL